MNADNEQDSIDNSCYVDEDCFKMPFPPASPMRRASCMTRDSDSICVSSIGHKESITSGTNNTIRKESIIKTPSTRSDIPDMNLESWMYCKSSQLPNNNELDKTLRPFGSRIKTQKLDLYIQKAKDLDAKYISPTSKVRKSWLESINEEQSSEEQLSDEDKSAYTVQPQHRIDPNMYPIMENSRLSVDRQTTRIIHPKYAGPALIERLSRAYRK